LLLSTKGRCVVWASATSSNTVRNTRRKAQGAPTDPPLDRRTDLGAGRVDATPGQPLPTRDAHAAQRAEHRAPARHRRSTGALCLAPPPVILLLKALAKATQGATGHDSTQYGYSMDLAAPHPSPSSHTTSPPSPPPSSALMPSPSAKTQPSWHSSSSTASSKRTPPHAPTPHRRRSV
jgi:hypothetical protein